MSDPSSAPVTPSPAPAPVPPVKKESVKPAAKPVLKHGPRIWFKDPVTGEQKLRGEAEK